MSDENLLEWADDWLEQYRKVGRDAMDYLPVRMVEALVHALKKQDYCPVCDGAPGAVSVGRETIEEIDGRLVAVLRDAPQQAEPRWTVLRFVSNSGRTLFGCGHCGRVSQTPDKECPAGCPVEPSYERVMPLIPQTPEAK